MKNFYKLMLVFVIAAVSYVFVSTEADAINKNNYISKVYPITDAMNTIQLDVTPAYEKDIESLTIKVGKTSQKFSYSDLFTELEGKKQIIEFTKKFTVGTSVQVYANYIEYDENYNEVKKTVLVDTLKVADKTAPAVRTTVLTVRSTVVTIKTESGATLSATYNGKKVALKKKSATIYKTTIAKPIVGKKLVIKATDKAKNSKNYVTPTIVPKTVKLTVNNISSSTKKVQGKIAGSVNTDVAYFTVASKTYKAKVKSGKFTITFPANIKTPNTGKVVVKDKNNNVLASANVSVYKYAALKIGMTPAQALNTPEGKPTEIDKMTYEGDKLEVWTYYIGDKVKIVTFFNGKLDYISK